MSSIGNKINHPRTKGLVDKQRVKCVKFSKASDNVRTTKPVKSDNLIKTCIRTVSNTDGSVKSCSSSVSGFDLTDSLDRDKNSGITSNIHQEVSAELDATDDFKLAVPELCTSLKIANNLLGAVASAKESRQGVAANNREKNIALAKSKALAMMNVPFEEQVFKDLIALNINTGDLNCGVKMKSKTFERVKDREPELSDYFRPSFHNEFVVKCALTPFEIDKNLSFDGFSLTERARNWESRD
ncbi:hypothetical protein LSTR_LSTR012353 [Laodelphax striatellus]|uniref:Protein phosphatase 1 regulatory subunit 35 C-terminal domain-containing protein n=1 Tax=Laodelphax striatellus TaxID=195883 RepID=A0A482WKL7_LAOST|nr:hypothetical protein LSTR_LSTR012353 [Laodelphax striatellus]